MTAHINCLNVSSVVQRLDVFWYSIFHFFRLVFVQIGNSNENVRLLVSVCEAFCHHRVCVCLCVWNVSELIFLSVCSLYITRRKAGVATRWLNKHITQLHITQTQLVCAVKGARGSEGTSSSSCSPRLSSLLVLRSFLPITHFRGMKTGWERWSGIHRCVYLIVISERICPC